MKDSEGRVTFPFSVRFIAYHTITHVSRGELRAPPLTIPPAKLTGRLQLVQLPDQSTNVHLERRALDGTIVRYYIDLAVLNLTGAANVCL